MRLVVLLRQMNIGSNPFFSIIVPNFNYANYLGDCLCSISSQTFRDYEVLICDGGSTDHSLGIIRDYISDSRFILFSESDNGQANSINSAIRRCCGRIICYLNSDDYFFSSTALATVYALFNNHPWVSVVSLGGFYVNSSRQINRSVDYSLNGLLNLYDMRRRIALLQPSTFWSRHLHEEGIMFSENLPTSFDTFFFWSVYARGNTFYIDITIPVSCYRIHGSNITSTQFIVRLRDRASFARHQGYPVASFYLACCYKLFLLLQQLLPKSLLHMIFTVFRLVNNVLAYITLFRHPSF